MSLWIFFSAFNFSGWFFRRHILFFVKRNFNVIFILNDSFEANIFRLESAEKEYFQLLFTWMWRLHICTIQLVYTIDKFCIHKQGATHFN